MDAVVAPSRFEATLVHALTATPVWYVAAWSIPGVVIGGSVGS